MTAGEAFYTRVSRPAELGELLESLCRPGAAVLIPEAPPQVPLPVFVETARSGDGLRVDVSAVREEAAIRAVIEGGGFRLAGKIRNGLVRSPVLTVRQASEEEGRKYCECELPAYLETLQRRSSFRATLQLRMPVRVDLRDGDATTTGWLRDLSLEGCLVELMPSAVALLDERDRLLQLEMTFPDGTRFTAAAWPRHQVVEQGRILCGFELGVTSPEQERTLWYLVREIEREAARSAASGARELRPSSLFSGHALDAVPGRDVEPYRHVPARRLASCAAFIAAQVVQLREGGSVDSAMLSRHADQLLALHAEDREGLLFALACLHHEPPIIQHGLAVATRWADLAVALGLQPSLRKALAAAGMVHDLGKALLPRSLCDATHLDAGERRQVEQHVALVEERLKDCAWLLPVAVQVVVEAANERLDGSGYPGHRGAANLHELMRLAAVIDVIDAMGRTRPDRPARPIHEIYQYLRQSPHLFDQQAVDRCIRHFGVWPVGTLVRFPRGETGWVLSLAEDRSLAEVRLVEAATQPDATDGTLVRGMALVRLGEPLAAVPPDPAA